MTLKTIVAINGSTREKSTNALLIQAIKDLTRNSLIVHEFNKLADLPHFNADLDDENPPKQITDFRNQLKTADGILICTPEYAMGVPGSLKNAIDWTVSSCEFMHKPTALITASSHGLKGHAALLETLKIIEAKMSDDTQLVISFVKTKIKEAGITEQETLQSVLKLLEAFKNLMD
jgi:chromate reductase, NAD(P)H dehydrogenase (quinone)